MAKNDVMNTANDILKELEETVNNIKMRNDSLYDLLNHAEDDVDIAIMSLYKAIVHEVPVFIKEKMFVEGIRFLVAVKNVMLTSTSEEIDHLSSFVQITQYFDWLIDSGNLDKTQVDAFRVKYERNDKVSSLDIFTSNKITL